MATKLDKTIKREIELDGQAYMVTIAPDGVKLTQKGFRKGREMTWRQLWSGASEEGGAGGTGGGGANMGSATGGGSTSRGLGGSPSHTGGGTGGPGAGGSSGIGSA